jgi:tripartite-type tricarboxylate transporter receptor subunit TctC
MNTDRRHVLAGAAALALVGADRSSAQSGYPNRPIRIVVPYPPGGGTDYFARLVGGAMGEALGQSVVVENRAGAATIIGAEAVAHAAPDGYTILLGDTATFAANKSLYQKLPYDPQRDFSPVTLTGRFAIVLLVNTNKLKVGSLQELIDAARRGPGTIDYASPGVGSPFHLATELLASAAGIKLNHVPYRGVAPALQDLAAGQMGMMLSISPAPARNSRPLASRRSRSPRRRRCPACPAYRPLRRAALRASKPGPGRASSCPPARRPTSSARSTPATGLPSRRRTSSPSSMAQA